MFFLMDLGGGLAPLRLLHRRGPLGTIRDVVRAHVGDRSGPNDMAGIITVFFV